MGKVTAEWKNNIDSAYQLIPAVKKRSQRDFRPPPTIESDFERLLNHEVPHVNYTFELLPDWFDQFRDDYEPLYIRGQQTPIDWKSKIGNSDMSTNFKVTHKVPIRKGDMVIREDGTVYLLSWNITNHANNQATQITECNSNIEFTRILDDEVDSDGFVVKRGGRQVIVPSMPCSHSEYAGRPDYSSSQGQPGMTPDHLITVNLQWNSTTKRIHLHDEFVIGSFTYRVINISIAEVNIAKEYGVLTIHAKRVAGGGVSDGEV